MLIRDDALLLVVDVQERLLPHIHEHEEMLKNTSVLVRGAQVLGLPVTVTEQYRKGLGPTAPLLSGLFEPFEPLEKSAFSCLGDAGIEKALAASGRRQVLLCGIEAHVCVYQTARDLIAAGYTVHLAADCVSSRSPRNRRIAVRRMETMGARLTTAEMALFEMLVVSGTDEFKAISKIVK
jgi:nicotinamidase-related amidase